MTANPAFSIRVQIRQATPRLIFGHQHIAAEPRGDRAVNLERNTLNNAYKYAIRKELVTSIPVSSFPKFHPTSAVKHCREFMPQNAAELHNIARLLFLVCSEALAWQLLLEAYVQHLDLVAAQTSWIA